MMKITLVKIRDSKISKLKLLFLIRIANINMIKMTTTISMITQNWIRNLFKKAINLQLKI